MYCVGLAHYPDGRGGEKHLKTTVWLQIRQVSHPATPPQANQLAQPTDIAAQRATRDVNNRYTTRRTLEMQIRTYEYDTHMIHIIRDRNDLN